MMKLKNIILNKPQPNLLSEISKCKVMDSDEKARYNTDAEMENRYKEKPTKQRKNYEIKYKTYKCAGGNSFSPTDLKLWYYKEIKEKEDNEPEDEKFDSDDTTLEPDGNCIQYYRMRNDIVANILNATVEYGTDSADLVQAIKQIKNKKMYDAVNDQLLKITQWAATSNTEDGSFVKQSNDAYGGYIVQTCNEVAQATGHINGGRFIWIEKNKSAELYGKLIEMDEYLYDTDDSVDFESIPQIIDGEMTQDDSWYWSDGEIRKRNEMLFYLKDLELDWEVDVMKDIMHTDHGAIKLGTSDDCIIFPTNSKYYDATGQCENNLDSRGNIKTGSETSATSYKVIRAESALIHVPKEMRSLKIFLDVGSDKLSKPNGWDFVKFFKGTLWATGDDGVNVYQWDSVFKEQIFKVHYIKSNQILYLGNDHTGMAISDFQIDEFIKLTEGNPELIFAVEKTKRFESKAYQASVEYKKNLH